MMRPLFLAALACVLLSNSKCGNKETGVVKYKGRLEIKAICMNYTIGLVEGDMAPGLVAEHWTDETTNKSYTKVFKLGNPCDFPATIKQGDEFYFIIDTAKGKNCAVCMAYYPTPPKSLRIKIIDK